MTGGLSLRWALVALAYAGAVVGAGFASGQEIYVFFSRHGTEGGWGILLAGTAFFLLGSRALDLGAQGVHDYRTLLRLVYPSRAVPYIDALAMLFLAGGMVVVAAGAGAVVHTLCGVPAPVGSLVLLVVAAFISVRGASGVLAANGLLVPVLTVVALMVALHAGGRFRAPGSPRWWVSSLLYVSYNLFTGLLALLGLGRLLPARAERRAAAAAGALLLVLLALALHRALLGAGGIVGSIPILDLARGMGPVWAGAYAVALGCALVTTGVAQTFSFGERFGARRVWWVFALWPATWIGFQTLVRDFYPLMGVLSVIIWWPVLLRRRIVRQG